MEDHDPMTKAHHTMRISTLSTGDAPQPTSSAETLIPAHTRSSRAALAFTTLRSCRERAKSQGTRHHKSRYQHQLALQTGLLVVGLHLTQAALKCTDAAWMDSPAPDQDRVIIAFDLDCFYAQCEEVRNPALCGKCLGVTQKQIIVTCNYEARAAGVGKLMNTEKARALCPQLVLVPGEDLTPYREASQAILSVLSHWGPACRQGLDEVFVDATQVVRQRLASGFQPTGYTGHVYSSGQAQVVADTHWRPQDLRLIAPGVIASSTAHAATGQQMVWRCASEPAAVPDSNQQAQASAGPWTGGNIVKAASAPPGSAQDSTVQADASVLHGSQPAWVQLLQVGSAVAAEARAAVLAKTGFRCSAGIACNKLLAKLCSGLHKPNDQTVMPPTEALPFILPLPVRALPGVGHKIEAELTNGLHVTTVAQLRDVPRPRLVQVLGERVGSMLWELSRGLDSSQILPQQPPRQLSVEDSFKSCTSLQAAQVLVQRVLAPDLLTRVIQDCAEHARAPATLTVKWRYKGEGNARNSTSTAWPVPASALTRAPDPDQHNLQQLQLLVTTTLSLLSKKLKPPFCLTLINLAATNFKATGPAAGVTSGQLSLERYLQNGGSSKQLVSMDAAVHVADGKASGAQDLSWAALQARRDLGSRPGAGLLLAKSRERQLREAGPEGIDCTQAQGIPQQCNKQPIEAKADQRPSPPRIAAAHPSAGSTGPDEKSRLKPDVKLVHAHLQQQQQQQRQRHQGMHSTPSLATLDTWPNNAGTYSEGPLPQPKHNRHDTAPTAALHALPDEQSQWYDARCAGSMDMPDVAMLDYDIGNSSPWEHDDAADNGCNVEAAQKADASNHNVQQTNAPAWIGEPMQSVPSLLAGKDAGQSEQRATAPEASPSERSLMHVHEVAARVLPAGRVILHADADCFYCQVERLDDPQLNGVPLAVKQFNAGGFVAVSYEARAAGIRCGDGAGPAALVAIPWLRDNGAVSEEEARRRCPGLQVRPMRTGRYRQVAEQVLQVLREYAPNGEVEKTSYDDFYIDLTAWAVQGDTSPCGTTMATNKAATDAFAVIQASDQMPEAVKVVREGCWDEVCIPLRRGVAYAIAIRAAVHARVGIVLSAGIATNKLLARCCSPLNKPNGIAVLPSSRAAAFMQAMPIKSVPQLGLRGKTGDEVVAALGITFVGQLPAFTQQQLIAQFGPELGARLAGLPHGLDGDVPVKARGAPQSLLVERSSAPLTRFAAVRQALEPLVVQLWGRLVHDTCMHSRTPVKLCVAWRQGYGGMRSRTGDMPAQVINALRPFLPSAALPAAAPAPPAAPPIPFASSPVSRPTSPPMKSRATAVAMTEADGTPTNPRVATSAASVAAVESPALTVVTPEGVSAAATAATMPEPGQPGFNGCHALLEAACWLFKAATASSGGRTGLEITRLAVSALYGKGGATQQQAALQPRISMFLKGSKDAPSNSSPTTLQRHTGGGNVNDMQAQQSEHRLSGAVSAGAFSTVQNHDRMQPQQAQQCERSQQQQLQQNNEGSAVRAASVEHTVSALVIGPMEGQQHDLLQHQQHAVMKQPTLLGDNDRLHKGYSDAMQACGPEAMLLQPTGIAADDGHDINDDDSLPSFEFLSHTAKRRVQQCYQQPQPAIVGAPHDIAMKKDDMLQGATAAATRIVSSTVVSVGTALSQHEIMQQQQQQQGEASTALGSSLAQAQGDHGVAGTQLVHPATRQGLRQQQQSSQYTHVMCQHGQQPDDQQEPSLQCSGQVETRRRLVQQQAADRMLAERLQQEEVEAAQARQRVQWSVNSNQQQGGSSTSRARTAAKRPGQPTLHQFFTKKPKE